MFDQSVFGALRKLQDELADYDRWEAEGKAKRAEAERTGDWNAYDRWQEAEQEKFRNRSKS